jgi:hypothetical protein
MALRIEALAGSPAITAALSDILIAVVAAGGSVGFMHPLSAESAADFWRASLAAAGRGEHVVLGAYDDNDLVGIVALLLQMPPNQPHRAEIAKMMTRPNHRHRGIATALLRAAEDIAVARGRTMLVLDTAADGGASRLYESLGFTPAGLIPDYALKPHGGLTGTMVYWKRLPQAAPYPASG